MIILHDLVRILHDDNDRLVIHSPATQRRGISYTIIGVGVLLSMVYPACLVVGPIWSGSRDDGMQDALGCGMLGVLFAIIGRIILSSAADIDFHFCSKEKNLLVCRPGNQSSIVLDRIEKAAVADDGDGGYVLKLKLCNPDDEIIVAWSIQESNCQLRLLTIAERIGHFLEVATGKSRI